MFQFESQKPWLLPSNLNYSRLSRSQFSLSDASLSNRESSLGDSLSIFGILSSFTGLSFGLSSSLKRSFSLVSLLLSRLRSSIGQILSVCYRVFSEHQNFP